MNDHIGIHRVKLVEFNKITTNLLSLDKNIDN